MERVQPSEVEIGPVHDVERAGLRQKQVEDVHVAELGVRNMDERGDASPQVEQRMQLDPGLRRTEQRPREDGQAQVYRRSVEGEDGVVEFQSEVVVRVQGPGDADEFLGEFRVHPPVPPRVGVGQGVARNTAADAHVVELRGMRAQSDLDVAQTLPVRQLRERHAQELAQAGKRLDVAVSAVAGDAFAENVHRQMLHHLREDVLACVHGATSEPGP